MVFHMDPSDWTDTKEKCSILNGAVSHKGVSTEFGKSKKTLCAPSANGFYSTPISVCIGEAVVNVRTPDLSPCL